MKKTIFLWLFCFASTINFAQEEITPGGYSDTVFDNTGRKYALKNIAIDPMSTEPQAFAATTVTCQSGYFVLHFAPGSGFDGIGLPDSDRRAVMCQLFADISCFIKSPLNSACHTTTNTSTFVHLYIDSSAAGPLASATSFYSFPLSPLSPNPGITEGAVHKTIVSGVDAYTNVLPPLSIFASSSNIYHGLIKVNNSYNWNYNMASAINPPTQYDFYSLILHEAAHALGFNSLISPNGGSLFGSVNNYYSMYDVFLKDYLGNNIITNNSNPCSLTSYSLNPSAVVSSLTGSFCTGITDLTNNCSTAPRYVDGIIDIKVYHPNCFELGSSLSHFEDICTVPAGFSSTCTAFPTNNNLYYTVSNSNGTGNCYVKRYLKPEERQVLCDIGYSVEATYSSPVAGAPFTYTAGACSGTNIWGVNDGLNSSGYSYVGTSINIPTTAIIANDAPSTTSISCVSFVYNYPGVILTVSGGSVSVTYSAGPVQYCGPVLIQYIPKNSLGQSGNITYIYAYLPCSGGCTPPNLCNMVQNGGFESITTATNCAGNLISGSNKISCWDAYKNTPDFVNRTCTTFPNYQLGAAPILPLTDTWNGVPNNIAMGMIGLGGPQTFYVEEPIKTGLTAPLVPTNTYVISFWAYNISKSGTNLPPKDMVLTFASAPNVGVLAPTPITNFSYPAGLNVIKNFTLSAADINTWRHYTTTVVFSGSTQHNCLILGPNQAQSNIAGSISSNMQFYTYVDDISVLPVGLSAPFYPPNPVCLGASINNLGLYTSVTGTFSGTGVTNSGGTYSFNAVPNNTLIPGYYPVTLTYTNGGGCVNTTVEQIAIAGISASTVFCNYNNYTLTAFGYPAGTTFTWLPSGQTTQSISVAGNVNTTYTLVSSFSVCNTATFTPNIIPNSIISSNPGPWCAGISQPLGIALPSYTLPTAITQTWSVGSLTVPVISVNYLGTTNPVYSATTSVSGCTNIASYTATWLPTFTLSVPNQTFTYCSNLGIGVPLSATATPSAGITFTWMPGSLTGASQTVTPSSNTIYTVSAGYGGLCTATNVVTVNVSTVCCSGTNYMSAAVSSGTYSGTWAINQNVVISNTVVFNGEFKIAPNVTITVNNGAYFDISGSHLYACGTSMWQGIVLRDGAKVRSAKHNLIEDAIIAFDVTSHTTSTVTPYILEVANTILNKNYVGIKIENYQRSFSPYPFRISNSVFSSRNFTFTPTSWPDANTADLRSVTNSTTGLVSPYGLQSATVTLLKSPWILQSSHIGIQINNSGVTSGSNFYGIDIDNSTAQTDFNLFDALAYGIDATNSNLRSQNNVFQNTQRVTEIHGGPRYYYLTVGGSAIRQTINTNLNANLDLRTAGTYSANVNYGNRFWNCHSAVEGTNTYRFNIEQAIIRSVQSTTAGTSAILPGNTGIYINTNRFQYNMRYNEFTNINNAINASIVSGTYDVGAGVQTGIYAAQMVINNNVFGPQTSTATAQGNNYLNNAITVTSPNAATWQFASNTGLFIQNNNINRAYRGIAASGLASYSCVIINNTVKLSDDNLYFGIQRGIDVSSTQNKVVVATNTLSATGITNTLISLAYFGANTGSVSPKVTCNDLSSSYKGFEFNATNLGTFWRGNLMNTHARGLVLSSSATISPQGSSGAPQDNAWNGTWTAGTNFGTWVDASDATFSPIWYKFSLALPTPSGNVVPGLRYGASGTLSLTTGSYDCSGGGGQRMASQNNYNELNNNPSTAYRGNNASFNASQYVNETTLYRYINEYPSAKDNNIAYTNFYTSKVNTSIDQFMQAEKALYDQQPAQAIGLINSVAVSNNVETNYKNFYTIYAKWQTGIFTSADSILLVKLVNLCPGLDGEVIYQARALYNAIYKTVISFNENCDPLAQENLRSSNLNKIDIENNWTIELYPNPANSFVNILSSKEKDQLYVKIADISGKTVFVKQVITSNFICNLELDLLPGSYIVTITNDKNNTTNKKFIITK